MSKRLIAFLMHSRNKLPRWFSRARDLAKEEWARQYRLHRDAIYLTDPSAHRKIDRFFKREIIPAVLKAMSKTGFKILNQDKLESSQDWHMEASRTLSVVIEDPARPMRSVPCYTRLGISCHVDCVRSLSNYLSLELPLTADLKLIKDVLAETSHHGIPSQLSVSDESYSIVFESGGFGAYSDENIQEKIRLRLRAFCEYIEAAYELESSNWSEPILFRKLIREANHALSV